MSKRLGRIKGCKYETSFMAFERVKISLLGCVWNIFNVSRKIGTRLDLLSIPQSGLRALQATHRPKLLPSCLIVISLLGCVWNIFNV